MVVGLVVEVEAMVLKWILVGGGGGVLTVGMASLITVPVVDMH